jgi:hypothetical protein
MIVHSSFFSNTGSSTGSVHLPVGGGVGMDGRGGIILIDGSITFVGFEQHAAERNKCILYITPTKKRFIFFYFFFSSFFVFCFVVCFSFFCFFRYETLPNDVSLFWLLEPWEQVLSVVSACIWK